MFPGWQNNKRKNEIEALQGKIAASTEKHEEFNNEVDRLKSIKWCQLWKR
jgi:hypothetical protein